jgi:hypothetical protein
VPDPEPCPDLCPVVLIKVKVHPCLDLNFAGSRQKTRPLQFLSFVSFPTFFETTLQFYIYIDALRTAECKATAGSVFVMCDDRLDLQYERVSSTAFFFQL